MPIASAATSVANHCRRQSSLSPPLALRVTVDRLLLDCLITGRFDKFLFLQHQAMSTKTKTLHDACDRLLIEKQRLIEFAEALRSKLKYFDELENVLEKYKHIKNYSTWLNGSNPTMAVAATAAKKEKEKETSIVSNDNGKDIGNGSGKESPHLHEKSDLPERYITFWINRNATHNRLEHNLSDSPFASPKADFLWLLFFNLTTIVTLKTANKCMNLLQQQQSDTQRATVALMMGEDMHKFGRSRLDRNEFLMNSGLEMVNLSSKQIYLTFPVYMFRFGYLYTIECPFSF
ncbi:hypothetical protein CsSME_00011774 [Camellia sinensis var. sinensis]